MRNAQQRGALCAHGELRNCLYQWQFRARRRHITSVPPRGGAATPRRWEFSPPSSRVSRVLSIASPVQGEVDCRRQDGGVVKVWADRHKQPSRPYGTPSLTQGGHWLILRAAAVGVLASLCEKGGATCAAWRKSERGYDLSEARFDEIERDLNDLYEHLKDL